MIVLFALRTLWRRGCALWGQRARRVAERARLVVLDAGTLGPLAEAKLDIPLPLGFHGSFLPAGG